MRRFWPALSLVAATVVVAAAGCGGSDSSSNADTTAAGDTTQATETTAATDTTATSGTTSDTLTGSVGPGFVISMGQSTVAAGTYTLKVDDKADVHNFHLTGDGVDVATDVAGIGEQTFTVTLKPGTYTFVCDPHAAQMHGTLTVT